MPGDANLDDVVKLLGIVMMLSISLSLMDSFGEYHGGRLYSPVSSSSPSPTPPLNENLAIIPDDWDAYNGTIIYDGGVQIGFLDNSIIRTSGHPSIRLEPHTSVDPNTAREVDGRWYPCEIGDHIIAKIWIRTLTNYSTLGYPNCGGRMGIDFYNATHPLPAQAFWQDYYDSNYTKGYVRDYNGGAWQQPELMLDFVVPETVGDSLGNPSVPTEFVLWIQAAPWVEHATSVNVWFADAELYINPQ